MRGASERKEKKMEPIKGLHHVTAVARDPQRNVDFYRNVLGQRLVKRTVNFDSPDTYHFYFADETGTPGSVLTFFAWGRTGLGVRGNGETNAVAYNVPVGSLAFWEARLKHNGITPEPVRTRFGQKLLAFADPDGMGVELVEVESPQPFSTGRTVPCRAHTPCTLSTASPYGWTRWRRPPNYSPKTWAIASQAWRTTAIVL